MITIDNIKIDSEIPEAKFLCDLKSCKGACCTFYGDNGAPLTEEEVFRISDNLEKIKKYLSERSLNHIKERGFVKGASGTYTTECIDKKECVFVIWDGDVAKCGIEKAYHNGDSNFRKPLSCHLFPVRIANTNNGQYMYYEKIEECEPGVENGKRQDIGMIEMLEESLVRAYGRDWYEKLKKIASNGLHKD